MIATESDARPLDNAAERASAHLPDALFVLRPVRQDDGVAAVALVAGRHVIGASPACDVRLDVPGVEPKHCLIVIGPHRAVVRAYVPETRLNGNAINEASLAVGDVLSVGPVELRLDAVEETLEEATQERGDAAEASPQEITSLLHEVHETFAVADEDELRLKRWREDLSRRENDLAIAAAALRDAKSQRVSAPEPSHEGNDSAEPLVHVNRLRRRLAEMSAEITSAQSDVLARERALRDRSDHLESWLAAAAASEAKCRDDERRISEEWDRLNAERGEHERRAAELAQRADELDRRHVSLDQIVADIAARERAIVEDANSCKAARAQLAVDRAAITTQQDALRADRDRLAKDRLELADERELLRLEIADLTRHREDANAQIELALEELQALEAQRRSSEADSGEVAASDESQRAAEIELAWRERDFELREVELNWQRSELNEQAAELQRLQIERERDLAGFQEWRASSFAEREAELERREVELEKLLDAGAAGESALRHVWLVEERQRLAAVTEALAAERAALRAEEARFAASVREELARRDAEAARAVAAASVEALALPIVEPVSNDESECVVDVAARGTSHVDDRLHEFENALATLFDGSDDPALRTDVIAADSNADFWTPLEKVETPIKVGGFELDDAANPDSVARYMQELLRRMREDNPLVPPAPPADADADPSDDDLATRTVSAVYCEPFELPTPRQALDKDELRAQTESLRGVANLSARSAIKQHSLRLRKAELFAKGVLTIVAILIGGVLMHVYARSGSDYLWHVVVGSATVLFVMHDFLMSCQRLTETMKDGDQE